MHGGKRFLTVNGHELMQSIKVLTYLRTNIIFWIDLVIKFNELF